MATTHDCDECKKFIRSDVCYCEGCAEEMRVVEYETGKAEGHAEGYAQATREAAEKVKQ